MEMEEEGREEERDIISFKQMFAWEVREESEKKAHIHIHCVLSPSFHILFSSQSHTNSANERPHGFL